MKGYSYDAYESNFNTRSQEEIKSEITHGSRGLFLSDFTCATSQNRPTCSSHALWPREDGAGKSRFRALLPVQADEDIHGL